MDIAEKYIYRLNRTARESLKRGRYNKACAAIHACAWLEYRYNQNYIDTELENCCMEISKKFAASGNYHGSVKKSVLFYDGFGADTRGLAMIYIKALCESGYQVHYVTVSIGRKRLLHLKKLLEEYHASMDYLPASCSHIQTAELLCGYFHRYRPEHAFFYTLPNDVSAVAAFQAFKGKVKRYQINLTDHAFWLGINCFDICIEFREYGAGISEHYRGIAREKIRILPYYPYVCKDIPFQGFPFQREGKKVVFSGGALYKTFDRKLTYYRIVNHILSSHENVIFLYAGQGDSRGIQKLQEKYPGRVCLVPERADLYQVMKHSDLYLNTYPLTGGLMTQYAALAGCIPLTLLYERPGEGDGLLPGQDDMGIMFERPQDLLRMFEKIMRDSAYRESMKEKMSGCIIPEERFRDSLVEIMEGADAGQDVEYVKINTAKFQAFFKEQFQISRCEEEMAAKKNISLLMEFPGIYIRKTRKYLKDRYCSHLRCSQ